MASSLFPLSLRWFARLKRAQAFAGLVFASYVIVHVGNGAAALVGMGVAEALLECMRPVTRGWWGALFWIGLPVTVHALSAPLVFLQERALRAKARAALERLRPGAKPTFGRRLRSAQGHRYAGLSLLLLITAHVAAMRPSVFDGAHGPEGYDRAALLLATSPVIAGVSLTLLALAIAYHLGYGAWMAFVNLGVLGPGRPRRLGQRIGAALGVAVFAAVVAAMVGLS
jgi:succinate dehydrogenase/fumarate reductase cytochrome b subunit